jgi:hypothetical protein
MRIRTSQPREPDDGQSGDCQSSQPHALHPVEANRQAISAISTPATPNAAERRRAEPPTSMFAAMIGSATITTP